MWHPLWNDRDIAVLETVLSSKCVNMAAFSVNLPVWGESTYLSSKMIGKLFQSPSMSRHSTGKGGILVRYSELRTSAAIWPCLLILNQERTIINSYSQISFFCVRWYLQFLLKSQTGLFGVFGEEVCLREPPDLVFPETNNNFHLGGTATSLWIAIIHNTIKAVNQASIHRKIELTGWSLWNKLNLKPSPSLAPIRNASSCKVIHCDGQITRNTLSGVFSPDNNYRISVNWNPYSTGGWRHDSIPLR